MWEFRFLNLEFIFLVTMSLNANIVVFWVWDAAILLKWPILQWANPTHVNILPPSSLSDLLWTSKELRNINILQTKVKSNETSTYLFLKHLSISIPSGAPAWRHDVIARWLVCWMGARRAFAGRKGLTIKVIIVWALSIQHTSFGAQS